ncbi:MAG: helix-turn-helix domain-containing protein [Candidatus Paceibacterota bacterium]|jgi:hypothetical protein
MTRIKTKIQAIALRKEGYSYSYISEKLSVRKSTLSDWLHDISFKPNKYTIEKIGKAHLASGNHKHQIKIKSLEKAEEQANKNIKNISKRDLTMLGLGIYIGEGGKTNGLVRIINSDPKVIKLMIQWLKVSFGVEIKQIKIRLYIYPDNKEKDCIKYWSKQTKVPATQFFKSIVDHRTNKKLSKKGKLPYGTAHISVKSFGNKKHGIYLHRLIMAWINRIL